MPYRRPGLAAVLGVAVTLTLGACSQASGGSLSAAAKNGGAGYVAGDGTIETYAPADRSTPIRLQGTTLEGTRFDTASYRGKVVVINTWGSWCPPCNTEAPALQKTWQATRATGVQFVGVDLRDSVATGRAFQRKYGITYPSLTDGTSLQPQLKGKAASTPSTLVLDRAGRLAARVSGAADATILKGLVDDVVRGPT